MILIMSNKFASFLPNNHQRSPTHFLIKESSSQSFAGAGQLASPVMTPTSDTYSYPRRRGAFDKTSREVIVGGSLRTYSWGV